MNLSEYNTCIYLAAQQRSASWLVTLLRSNQKKQLEVGLPHRACPRQSLVNEYHGLSSLKWKDSQSNHCK